MSYLRDLDENIDSRPFTGKRTIEETKVVCRGKNLKDEYFGPTSMLGATKDEFYESLAEWNLTPDKEYTVIEIEGYGDVYDVTIKQDDKGNPATFMSIFFEFPESEEQKCRVCGCTWNNACVGSCYWVEEDLCSRCVDKKTEETKED